MSGDGARLCYGLRVNVHAILEGILRILVIHVITSMRGLYTITILCRAEMVDYVKKVSLTCSRWRSAIWSLLVGVPMGLSEGTGENF